MKFRNVFLEENLFPSRDEKVVRVRVRVRVDIRCCVFAVEMLFSFVVDVLATELSRMKAKRGNNTREEGVPSRAGEINSKICRLLGSSKTMDDSGENSRMRHAFEKTSLNGSSIEANVNNSMPINVRVSTSARTHIGGMKRNEVCIRDDERTHAHTLSLSLSLCVCVCVCVCLCVYLSLHEFGVRVNHMLPHPIG